MSLKYLFSIVQRCHVAEADGAGAEAGAAGVVAAVAALLAAPLLL